MMKSGGEEGVETDQYRVFKFIIEQLEHGEKPLRLMIQASAGTGKSFLLTSVFLWAVLQGVKTTTPQIINYSSCVFSPLSPKYHCDLGGRGSVVKYFGVW